MPNYALLDSAIEARRLDLGLSWKQLAEVAGISDVSLRNARKGRSDLNSLSKRRLEDALTWGHGSIDRVLDGGDPAPLMLAGGENTLAELRELLTAALDRVNQLERS